MSQIFESLGDKFENENKNMINQVDIHNRNVSLRNKSLPEKLEKYLNNEKERELESLYEENRQLLLEIAKLRKTNQMLVKDVSKKNEIIDNLDSNLVEVEEKLENIKKKNMNMYNEILNRERQNINIKNNNEKVENNSSEYFMKASNIGRYNTVDIKKSSLSKIDNRPKSTSSNINGNNIDIEDSKWFQNIILKTVKESKEYDNLKYEVEKLQKEVYSMQSDLNKNNRNISNDLVLQFSKSEKNLNGDFDNINTVFDSKNSINNTSSSVNTNSLAQELKEINSPNIDLNLNISSSSKVGFNNKNADKETMPPRSVHLLMGKTFSSCNNIDKKINQYKSGKMNDLNNFSGISVDLDKENSRLKNNFNNNFFNSTNIVNEHDYQFSNSTSNQYVGNVNFMNQRLAMNSSNMLYGGQKQPQITANNNNIKYTRFHNSNTSSTSVFNKRNSNNHDNNNSFPGNDYFRYQLNYVNNHRSLPFPGYIPSSSKVLNNIGLYNQYYGQEYIQNIAGSGNSNGNNNLPFRIKVTQKFRRTRNTSVPPKYILNNRVEDEVMFDCNDNDCNNNNVQNDIPQGYICFKTSITSPINHESEYLSPSSPYSFSSFGSGICPCDKATNYCTIKENNANSGNYIARNTGFKSRYFSSNNSTSKNQFKGSIGLLKLK
ncbi:hypothetical protein FG379_001789 [Cryptosporidium bovis]|uniref:uncharacterized protein n=1 Tax=Cryptosporidium bovis TaxID=310047 RepID=UPI00351A4DCB|nr:hypothetical protein FG379_001789 [Cryptosporidium bovis]